MSEVIVFMSHDVDWPRHGPGKEHILSRASRFTPDVIERVLKEGYNPYYGIPDIMEIEEKYGVRSTFFFRPYYDDGSDVCAYSDIIKELVNGGWEVGVHLNDTVTIDSILKQKEMIESLTGSKVVGARVHYLRISEHDYPKLKAAGIEYDSSLKHFKDRVDPSDMGYKVMSGVVVFPITIMDAYLFTYMGVKESEIINVFKNAIDLAVKHRKQVMTVLWHDSSIEMIGGRMYPKVLEYLVSREEVRIARGIDLLKKVV